MIIRHQAFSVLLALWVCLLNHSTGLPLTFAAQNGVTRSTRLSQVYEIDKSTQVDHKESTDLPSVTNDYTRTQEKTSNIDKSNKNDSQDNTVEIDRNITSKHLNTSIIVLKSKDGPLIQTTDNKTNIYVLASVLDMEKGLYYIPSNTSANSSEGWVFWKIPHLYKLSNPTAGTPYDDSTASETTDGGSHNFYILMLGLGCFICGLMIMLIITLIILTRRFSHRTRPPHRYDPPLIVEADLNAPKVGDESEPPTFCENLDYYTLPYGPGVQRLRRFSSDDALDILRRRAGPPLPPHFCACQRCLYEEEEIMTVPENEDEDFNVDDDDVPLINIDNVQNILTFSNNGAYSMSSNTDDDKLLLAAKKIDDVNNTSTCMALLKPSHFTSNQVSPYTEQRLTLSQNMDNMGRRHNNHLNQRCRSEPWIELSSGEDYNLSTELQECYCENDLLKLNTVSAIDAIPCATMDSLSEVEPHPEVVLSDAIDVPSKENSSINMSLNNPRKVESCKIKESDKFNKDEKLI